MLASDQPRHTGACMGTPVKACRVPVPCPQLIDPSLDYLVFLMLRRLKIGTYLLTGPRLARHMLSDRTKPLMLVVCTDAYGESMACQLEELRLVATECGVAVVHALSRRGLGNACGARHCLTVATIMGVPDEQTANLMAAVMVRAAEAYGSYLSQQPLQPASALPVFTELPVKRFEVPASLSLSMSSLSL